MTDAYGNEIYLDSTVSFFVRNKKFNHGKVIGFTKKKVRIMYVNGNDMCPSTILVYPYNVSLN